MFACSSKIRPLPLDLHQRCPSNYLSLKMQGDSAVHRGYAELDSVLRLILFILLLFQYHSFPDDVRYSPG